MRTSWSRRGSHAEHRWPLSVLAIALATGFLFVTAAVNADGDDLRPAGGDLASLLNERNRKVESDQARARELRQEIDELTASVDTADVSEFSKASEGLQPTVGLTEVEGPGVQVVLSDAPRDAELEASVDHPSRLVVHEQNLRGFVNALWAGGAEAVSLQGHRLTASNGIECVGNTVLLDGQAYSPPFRIEAVGDPAAMIEAINTLPETVSYFESVRKYRLGLEIQTMTELTIPGYDGNIAMDHASVAEIDEPSG